jgi:hypothetical protein
LPDGKTRIFSADFKIFGKANNARNSQENCQRAEKNGFTTIFGADGFVLNIDLPSSGNGTAGKSFPVVSVTFFKTSGWLRGKCRRTVYPLRLKLLLRPMRKLRVTNLERTISFLKFEKPLG